MNQRATVSNSTSLSSRRQNAAAVSGAEVNGHADALGSQPSPSRRRCFTAEYKLRILRDASAAKERGELAALLRREGLYSSHLTMWRAEARRGQYAALEPKRRGPKPSGHDPRDSRIAELSQANAALMTALQRAEAAIAAYKEILLLSGRSDDAAGKPEG